MKQWQEIEKRKIRNSSMEKAENRNRKQKIDYQNNRKLQVNMILSAQVKGHKTPPTSSWFVMKSYSITRDQESTRHFFTLNPIAPSLHTLQFWCCLEIV